MKTAEKKIVTAVVSFYVLLAVGAFMYGVNLYKLISMMDGGLTAGFVLRLIGAVFPPLGVIMGFV
jgi:hypothetical protein